MWISKRSYDDLLASHKREVDILRDWVQSLLMSQGAPVAPASTSLGANSGVGAGTPPDMALFVGDEEQDLRDAFEMDLISEDDLQEGLRQLAAANS